MTAAPVRSDRWWLWLLLTGGAGILAVLACQLQPGWQGVAIVLYMPMAAIGAVGAVAGVIRYRPQARSAWLLLTGSQLLFVAGSIAFVSQTTTPGLSDVLYLALYLPLIAAIMIFTRSRTSRPRPAELLDAGIVTTAAALVAWLHLIGPLATAHSVSVPARLVGMAYPVMDLLLLAVALRLALASGRRPPAYYLLAGGLTAYLATDIGYAILRVTGSYDVSSLIVFGFLIASTLIGTAGLHPSMVQMDQPPPGDDTAATGRRIAFLAAVSLIGPAELALRGSASRSDTLVIAGAGAVLVLLMITRMAGLVAAQRHLAITDGLTGLHTRRVFVLALKTETARARRAGTQVGILAIDVDHFKVVNDSHGHAAGDEVLREVARRLRTHCRASDIVARIGGEEFAVLAPATDSDTLAGLAERLRQAVHATPVTANHRTISTSVSIGAALYPADAADGEGALQAADQALYAAKRSGRNRLVTAATAAELPMTAADETAPGCRTCAHPGCSIEGPGVPTLDYDSGNATLRG